MTRPVRLHLSRAPGFDLQALSFATNGLPGTSVARPSAFGNPFMVDVYGREGAVDRFRRLMLGSMSTQEMSESSYWGMESLVLIRRSIRAALPTLCDRNLACWCALDAPCHADVLLELAQPAGEVHP